MLDSLFGSKTRAKLLNLFYNNTDSCFFVREITRELHENINSVRREIVNLAKIGIIHEVPGDSLEIDPSDTPNDQKEKRKYYKIQSGFPLYEELRGLIIRSKVLVDDDLLGKLKNLKGVKLLVLTGVFVLDSHSRADILIMGTVDKNAARRIIAQMEQGRENPLRYTIMTQKEFDYRNSMTDKFLFEIMEGKKIVVVDRR